MTIAKSYADKWSRRMADIYQILAELHEESRSVRFNDDLTGLEFEFYDDSICVYYHEKYQLILREG